MDSKHSSFEAFNFNSTIAKAIAGAGYTSPTPIQLQSIPSVLEGRDVMGLAQTGTGKTAAFVLPILQFLSANTDTRSRHVKALVVVPTRELAEQVHQTIKKLSAGTPIRSITIFGGVNINAQIQGLRNGADLIVACPGRLIDHIRQRTVDLTRVQHLVLDEADHMFDMGFLPDVRRIVQTVPRDRQTLMFSATMPAEIRQLALEVLREPVTIQADKGGPAKTVSHSLYPVNDGSKSDLLLSLLNECAEGSVLIFVRTKRRAKNLHTKLQEKNFAVTSLQGNLSQSRRRQAMEGFRKGKYRIMVATDIAARGIDVSIVSHVINFDMPDTVEAYTHRIGRTGRAAQTGSAHTFVTQQDESTVRSIERVLGAKLKRNFPLGLEQNAQRQTVSSGNQDRRVPRNRRFRGRGLTRRRSSYDSWANSAGHRN